MGSIIWCSHVYISFSLSMEPEVKLNTTRNHILGKPLSALNWNSFLCITLLRRRKLIPRLVWRYALVSTWWTLFSVVCGQCASLDGIQTGGPPLPSHFCWGQGKVRQEKVFVEQCDPFCDSMHHWWNLHPILNSWLLHTIQSDHNRASQTRYNAT